MSLDCLHSKELASRRAAPFELPRRMHRQLRFPLRGVDIASCHLCVPSHGGAFSFAPCAPLCSGGTQLRRRLPTVWVGKADSLLSLLTTVTRRSSFPSASKSLRRTDVLHRVTPRLCLQRRWSFLRSRAFYSQLTQVRFPRLQLCAPNGHRAGSAALRT